MGVTYALFPLLRNIYSFFLVSIRDWGRRACQRKPLIALGLCLDDNCFYLPGKRLWSVLIARLLTFFRFRTKLRLVLSVENVYRIGLREELSGRTNTAIQI